MIFLYFPYKMLDTFCSSKILLPFIAGCILSPGDTVHNNYRTYGAGVVAQVLGHLPCMH